MVFLVFILDEFLLGFFYWGDEINENELYKIVDKGWVFGDEWKVDDLIEIDVENKGIINGIMYIFVLDEFI